MQGFLGTTYRILKNGLIVMTVLFTIGCISTSRPQIIGTFYPTEPQKRNKRVFVFVHGINGDCYKTWHNDKSGKYFFQLLKEDTSGAGKDSDIFLFGYPSNIVDTNNTTIAEATTKLKDRLEFNRITTEYTQIIFVSHSMGGLITTKYLLDNPDVLSKVPLVLFFGTPFNGSIRANMGKFATGNPNFDEMSKSERGINEFLKELKRRWQDLPKKDTIRLRCAYEQDKDFGDYVVDNLSATDICGVSNSDGIGADHSNMVKPENRNTDAYFFLSRAVQSVPLPRDAVVYLEGVSSLASSGEIAVTESFPTIKEAFVTFDTIKNNNHCKIWISSDITCNDMIVAKVYDDIFFSKGSSTGPLRLNLVAQVPVKSDTSCYFRTRIPDTGYNEWNFYSKLTITFDNGKTKEYHFDKTELSKTKSENRRFMDF